MTRNSRDYHCSWEARLISARHHTETMAIGKIYPKNNFRRHILKSSCYVLKWDFRFGFLLRESVFYWYAHIYRHDRINSSIWPRKSTISHDELVCWFTNVATQRHYIVAVLPCVHGADMLNHRPESTGLNETSLYMPICSRILSVQYYSFDYYQWFY